MCLAGQVANPSSMSFECSDLNKSKERGQRFHNHFSCWYQSDTFEHEIECFSNCQNKRRYQFGLYLRLHFARQVLETLPHFSYFVYFGNKVIHLASSIQSQYIIIIFSTKIHSFGKSKSMSMHHLPN